MKPMDLGVVANSSIYFHNASPQAKKMFYYLLCTGHYYCNSEYIVTRNKLDSFLLMYIKQGNGFVTCNHVTTPFHQGQVVLLDCYSPHSYSSDGDLEIYWIHFDGNTSRDYYEYIISQSGNVITLKDTYSMEKYLMKIYSFFQNNSKIHEALISKYITNLLTDLILFTNEITPSYEHSDLVEDTISYICNNITGTLSLEELSLRVSLSPYYFTRVFKKETGYTPHEYIINARINVAKFYLKATPYPVKEICFSCGFTSESNFCTSFKKVVGITPSEYRIKFTQ